MLYTVRHKYYYKLNSAYLFENYYKIFKSLHDDALRLYQEESISFTQYGLHYF